MLEQRRISQKELTSLFDDVTGGRNGAKRRKKGRCGINRVLAAAAPAKKGKRETAVASEFKFLSA